MTIIDYIVPLLVGVGIGYYLRSCWTANALTEVEAPKPEPLHRSKAPFTEGLND